MAPQAPTDTATATAEQEEQTRRRSQLRVESTNEDEAPNGVDLLLERYPKTYSMGDEIWLQQLPKVELHVHLDGAFNMDIIWNHLMTEGMDSVPMKSTSPWSKDKPIRATLEGLETARDYTALCTCRGHRSLQKMLECWDFFLPVIKDNPEGLLEELAYDFCLRQAQQRVVYTEVRYSPHLFIPDDQMPSDKNDPKQQRLRGARTMIQAVTKGLERGCHEYGITIVQILCGICWNPEWTPDVVTLYQEFQPSATKSICPVVGIDVAAGEAHFLQSALSHEAPLLKAKAMGTIPLTIHAGEETTAPQDTIGIAVREYGARRIGHGYRMSATTREDVRRKKVHIEVCPTSSNETGGWEYPSAKHKDWTKHPMLTNMLAPADKPLSIGINSDDPGVFDTSLTWQYRIMLSKMKLSREVCIQTLQQSIDASFTTPTIKKKIRTIINDYVQDKVLPAVASKVPFDDRVGQFASQNQQPNLNGLVCCKWAW